MVKRAHWRVAPLYYYSLPNNIRRHKMLMNNILEWDVMQCGVYEIYMTPSL